MQEFDDDIVELDEAHVELLRTAAKVGNTHCAWVDTACASFDSLASQQL